MQSLVGVSQLGRQAPSEPYLGKGNAQAQRAAHPQSMGGRGAAGAWPSGPRAVCVQKKGTAALSQPPNALGLRTCI